MLSTDIDPELAAALTEKIESLTSRLSQAQQVTGLVDMAKRGQRGTIDDVMGELVSVGGRSHPCSPELRWQETSNRITGTVKFSQAFEGPPGHVHGGWVVSLDWDRSRQPPQRGPAQTKRPPLLPRETVVRTPCEARERWWSGE